MTDSKPSSNSKEQQDEKWYDRTRYQLLLFAIGIAIFVIVGALVLDWYIKPDTSGQKKDLVQALGLLTAGVAGAVGIFFTWRGQRITQESLQITRENTEENLRLTRQGQITERFTRAIDQLGATDDEGKKKLEIRLGGIYSLERIDKESPERAYHSTVMEVLTAYVRENSRWDLDKHFIPTTASEEAAKQDNGVEQETDHRTLKASHRPTQEREAKDTPRWYLRPRAKPTLQGLPTDILAILAVLKRRGEERVPEEHRATLDLRRANLQVAHLERANLREAILAVANLERANLEAADLSGAILAGANLEEANLKGASLQYASLLAANLEGAHLTGASLVMVDFQYANLRRGWLAGANLQESHFQEAILVGANLERANLERAWFLRADLQEAILERANLRQANLLAANLKGASLVGSDLRRASLRPANLQGADLREANLEDAILQADLQGADLQEAILVGADLQGSSGITEDQIEWTIGSNETHLPKDLNRPELWRKNLEEQERIITERLYGAD